MLIPVKTWLLPLPLLLDELLPLEELWLLDEADDPLLLPLLLLLDLLEPEVGSFRALTET